MTERGGGEQEYNSFSALASSGRTAVVVWPARVFASPGIVTQDWDQRLARAGAALRMITPSSSKGGRRGVLTCFGRIDRRIRDVFSPLDACLYVCHQ